LYLGYNVWSVFTISEEDLIETLIMSVSNAECRNPNYSRTCEQTLRFKPQHGISGNFY